MSYTFSIYLILLHFHPGNRTCILDNLLSTLEAKLLLFVVQESLIYKYFLLKFI